MPGAGDDENEEDEDDMFGPETEQDEEEEESEEDEGEELFGPPPVLPFPYIHPYSRKPPGTGNWYCNIQLQDKQLKPYRLIKRTPPAATIRWIRRLFDLKKGGTPMEGRVAAIINFAHSWPRALEVAREKDMADIKKSRNKFNNTVSREKRMEETPLQKSVRRAKRNAKDRARRAKHKAKDRASQPEDEDTDDPDEPDVEGMDPRGAPGAGGHGGAGGSGGAAIPVGA